MDLRMKVSQESGHENVVGAQCMDGEHEWMRMLCVGCEGRVQQQMVNEQKDYGTSGRFYVIGYGGSEGVVGSG